MHTNQDNDEPENTYFSTCKRREKQNLSFFSKTICLYRGKKHIKKTPAYVSFSSYAFSLSYLTCQLCSPSQREAEQRGVYEEKRKRMQWGEELKFFF